MDIASTIDSLILKQILTNFSRTIDNPYTLPAQVDFAAGTVTTSNSVTPILTDPVSNVLTLTKTVVGANVTKGTQTNIPGQSLSISGNDTWNQSWTLDPITDVDKLRRLRALYRFAVYGNRQRLLCEYNIQEGSGGGANQSNSPNVSVARTDQQGVTTTVNITGNAPAGKPDHKYVKKGCDERGMPSKYASQYVSPDPAFLTQPGCVLCAPSPPPAGDIALRPNEKLKEGWLYWDSNAPEGAFSIGTFGNHALYTTDPQAFYEFSLFVLESLADSASSNGGAAGGKTSGKKALVITGNTINSLSQ